MIIIAKKIFFEQNGNKGTGADGQPVRNGKYVSSLYKWLLAFTAAIFTALPFYQPAFIRAAPVNTAGIHKQAENAAGPLIDPVLKLSPANGSKEERPGDKPVVALTLDLCMGKTDRRIFDVLLQHNIPATLFVTRLWLQNKANVRIIEAIRAHLQLFEIGNHGAKHIPAIDDRATVYGLKTAGNLQTICAEAEGGLQAIKQAGLAAQMSKYFWYRGAAALYSPNALRLLHKAGFSIAGFSVNGDEGASLSAQAAFQHIISAKDGDVLIAHMNQPKRAAGQGVAEGITALWQKGYRFVKLSQAANAGKKPHLTEAGWPVEEKLLQNRQANLADSYPNCAFLLNQEDSAH